MTSEEIQQIIEQLKELVKTAQFNVAKAHAFDLIEVEEIQEESESLSKVYSILGIAYYYLSDYPKALEYYEKALQINEDIGNKEGIAGNIVNIGEVYRNLSDYPKALECYEKSLHINEEIGKKVGISANLHNFGNIYSSLSDSTKAIEYYEKALQINEEIGRMDFIVANFGCIGSVYDSLSDYPKALEYYEKALLIAEEIGNREGIAVNIGNIGEVYRKLSDYSKAIECYKKALQIYEEIGNKIGVSTVIGNLGIVYTFLADYSKALEYLNTAYTLSIEIGAKNLTMDHLIAYSELYEKMGYIDSAFSYFKQYIELKDEINSEETKKKATLFDQRRKIEEDEKARQLKLARFQEQEKLLHNILPITIADRILKQESFIADYFDSSTVMFMDLVGFTKLSSIAPPKQLVYLLDTIFTKADEIIERYGLEKIKTIGDGYMAVANVTTPLENHQKATASAALELLKGMKELVVTFPEELGDSNWTQNMNDIEIRIGIHTGEVVAGIIGKNKYTFDLWGDAVNVASRMESNSEPWKIHISEQFAKSIESNAEFKIIPRGEISIKGKGTMNTFWLEKAI